MRMLSSDSESNEIPTSVRPVKKETSTKESSDVLFFSAGGSSGEHEYLCPQREGGPAIPRLQHDPLRQGRLGDDPAYSGTQGIEGRRGPLHQLGKISRILRRSDQGFSASASRWWYD